MHMHNAHCSFIIQNLMNRIEAYAAITMQMIAFHGMSRTFRHLECDWRGRGKERTQRKCTERVRVCGVRGEREREVERDTRNQLKANIVQLERKRLRKNERGGGGG